MTLGVPGDVVTFAISSVTHAGVIIGGGTGSSDTTHNTVAYDFALPNGTQLVHCNEFVTTAITKLSVETD